MSEETTKDLTEGLSFEDRVFARFDAIESFLRSLNARVEVLESKTYDTKPIWERALKEIVALGEKVNQTAREIKEELSQTERKLREAISQTERKLREELSQTEGRLKEELTETKRELKELKREVTKRLDQIQAVQLSNRADIRDIEDRLEKLESTPS